MSRKARGAKKAAGRYDKSSTFVLRPDPTPDAAKAELMVDGLGINALTALAYSRTLGELDLSECMTALAAETRRVQDGNMGGPEAMLTAQAVTLNTIFRHLGHRSQSNMGKHLDTADRYMRLALKAQGQCRATLETLAEIKNPRVFARQANIASGPQQVNNGPVLNSSPSHAAIQETGPSKLLEDAIDGERVDGRTEGTTGRSDQAMATVGALNGTKDKTRKGASRTKRVSRR